MNGSEVQLIIRFVFVFPKKKKNNAFSIFLFQFLQV